MIFLRHDLLETGRSIQERSGASGSEHSSDRGNISTTTVVAAAAYLEEASQYLFSRVFRHYLPLPTLGTVQTHTNIFP